MMSQVLQKLLIITHSNFSTSAMGVNMVFVSFSSSATSEDLDKIQLSILAFRQIELLGDLTRM